MNDKGKGKVAAAAASPPTPAISPLAALSKKFEMLEMLSKGKGKSKEQGDPLPGRLPSLSPQHTSDGSSPFQSIPYPTPTRRVISASNRSRLRTRPFPLS